MNQEQNISSALQAEVDRLRQELQASEQRNQELAEQIAALQEENKQTREMQNILIATVENSLYLIASVLMDWTDEQVVSVLQTCHRAMKPESKVLIIDPLIGDTNEPSLGKIADLVILMETTGVIRSEEEYRVLLERAGFELTHNYETRAVGMHLLEAVPREG